jgi:hypothetical protein
MPATASERAEEEARRRRFSEDIRGVVGGGGDDDAWEDADSVVSYGAGYPDDPDFDDEDDEDETEEFDFENYLSMASSPTLRAPGTQGAAQVAYYAQQQQQLQQHGIRLGQHWPLPPTPQSAASSSTTAGTTTTTTAQHVRQPITAAPGMPSPPRGGPKLALDTGAAPPLRPPEFYAKAAGGTFYSPASSPAGSARSSALMAAAPASPRKGPQLDLAALQEQQQQRPSPSLQRPSHPTHARQGSDTVAYVREEIEGADASAAGGGVGGYRWVLERRRAGEDGSSELVRREVVDGGMI